MDISPSDFQKRVSKYSRVLYLCHRNADPDAIGSGFALQQSFGGDLGAVEDMSRPGAALSKAVGAEVLIDPPQDDYDFVVYIDSSVWSQVGGGRIGEYAVLDHHKDPDMLDGATFYIQMSTDSTAEIVWQIIKEGEVGKRAALGLLVGIISDTGRFKHARSGAFLTSYELMERCRVEYRDALAVLGGLQDDISQRIASLKAASRASICIEGKWIVATTQVGAFEGTAAMALVDLGADVAFAAGPKRKMVTVSGRAGPRAAMAGIDLSEIMRRVAKSSGGDGGGHAGAAAMKAEGSSQKLLSECRRMALERLSGNPANQIL